METRVTLYKLSNQAIEATVDKNYEYIPSKLPTHCTRYFETD